MKQHEFDAVPLGAEQFHHETGRLNTSRSSQRSNTRRQLRNGLCFSSFQHSLQTFILHFSHDLATL